MSIVGVGEKKNFYDGCNWLRGMSAFNESIEVNAEKKDPPPTHPPNLSIINCAIHPLLPLTHYKSSLSEKPKQNVGKL